MAPRKGYFEPLTENQRQAMFKEVNATEKSIKEDVKHIIEWFERQPHLPNITDERLITNFLLGCKNSLERAKKQLEHYYISRAKMPEAFEERDRFMAPVLQVAKKITLLPHPVPTTDGVRVCSITLRKNIEVDFTGEVLLKAVQMIIDILMKTDTTQMIAVVDAANATLPIISSCFPIMKKLVFLFTKTIPLRYQKIYFVNISPMTESFMQFFVSLLPKKISSRVEVWQSEPTKLATVISPQALPACFGGTMGELETVIDEWIEHFAECKVWLVAEQHLKADLKKVPEDHQTDEIIGEYGVEGSFRKINLD